MVCICSGVTPFLPICIWGSRWCACAFSCCFCLLVSVMVCGLWWVAYIGVYWWVLWEFFFLWEWVGGCIIFCLGLLLSRVVLFYV